MSINPLLAFKEGNALGTGLRQDETRRKAAPMIAQGDYRGAMQMAGQRGDMDMVAQMQQAVSQMDEQTRAQAAQRAQGIARAAIGVRQVPYEQRRAALAQQAPMLAQMGLDQNAIMQFDPTDEAIDGILAQVTPMEQLLKAQMPVAGKVVNNRLVDPYTGEVRGDFSDPAQRPMQRDAMGRMRYTDTGEVVPGFDEARPQGSGITINTGDAGAGSRPIVSAPPKDFQRVWDEASQTYRDMPIPGSESERTRAQESVQAAASLRASQEQNQVMMTEIDKAIEMSGFWSAGLMSQASDSIGSTPARNLRATLDTITANIGFDKLQEMRENSPTGGALGSVTERELQFLQSVRGSLDQAQSPEQLQQKLAQVRESLARLQAYRQASYELRYGQTEPGQSSPVVQPDGQIGQNVQSGQTRFRFNPETGEIE